MIGYHSVPVIVDAEQWGIEGWDPEVALEAMVQAADSMHLGLDAYAELGFIPSDHEHESVSKTLEYAFDDACIARYATATTGLIWLRGLPTRCLLEELVHPETGFIQAKRQGAWVEASILGKSTSISRRPMLGSTSSPLCTMCRGNATSSVETRGTSRD